VHAGPEPCAVRRITTDGMSTSFLQQVLGRLRAAGIVRARRGTGGGFWLAHAPEAVTIGDVVRAIHPAPAPAERPVGAWWRRIDERLQAELDSVTLAELATTR
jgi:Rrf2 family cysteine metabolism transcriptional repressor